MEAALGLAEAIQLAKYDVEHDEEKDGEGKPKPDAERDEITKRYQRAGRIVKSAGAVLKAATAKPRPNYLGAVDAATQLIAELTESKQIDAAAVVTSKLDAWTKAVNSNDEKAIMQAGIALGEAIDGLRKVIADEHAKAKQDAEARLGPGETLPDDGEATLPPGPTESTVLQVTPSLVPASYTGDAGSGVGGPMDDGGYEAPWGEPVRGGPRVDESTEQTQAQTQTPAASDTRVLSGSAWCAQYPTGTTIAELTDTTFRADVQAFHDAMVAAATSANKLNIRISATYRPAERAHLMHYAYKVYKGTTTPADANTASAGAGININWDHGNLATSKAKAGEMVTTYDIAYAPALTSRHTEGKAIDWTITWTGSLMIAKKGETTNLDCTGSGSTSTNLHKVGESYGVKKLVSDPPHWSTDGS